MAGAPRFRIDSAGARALLRSPEVRKYLEDKAKEMRGHIDHSEYEVDSQVGATRARAQVRTTSPRGAMHEARDHDLIRAAAMLRAQ